MTSPDLLMRFISGCFGENVDGEGGRGGGPLGKGLGE